MAGFPAFGQAEQRFALVVGNGNYRVNRLVNPPNDADDVAAALEKAGFQVLKAKDVNLVGFERVLADFERRLPPGSLALFYYAGHGVQVQGANILIPVGEEINTEAQARSRGVSVDDVLERMKKAGASTGLLWLDACRDNPFPGASRSGVRGLSVVQAPRELETFIVFSAEAGATAADGGGRNGVFTAALLKQLAEPGLEINDLFTRVKAEVARVTNSRQRPRTDSGLTRPLVLLDAEETVRRARAASDAKAAEVAALEAEIAQRQHNIAAARNATERQRLEMEQQRQQAILAAQRLEAENLAREAERQRLAAEASAQTQRQLQESTEAQAQRQRELEALAAQRRLEAERLNQADRGDPVALIRAYETARKALADVNIRFAQAWASTEREIQSIYNQRRANVAKENPTDGFESDQEYRTRLDQLTRTITSEEQRVLRERRSEHDRQLATQTTALEQAQERALRELEAGSFPLGGRVLRVAAGTFNRDTKEWPVTITSTDAVAPFTQAMTLNLSREADARAAFTAWDTAFKANGASATANFGIKSLGPSFGVVLKNLSLVRLTDNATVTANVPADPIRFVGLNAQGNYITVPATPKAVVTVTFSAGGTLSLGNQTLAALYTGQSYTYQTYDYAKPVTFTASYFNNQVENVTVTPQLGQTLPAAFIYRLFLDIVRVEGGSFQMGTVSGGNDNERPVHTVSVGSFYMGRTEVTQGQWRTVMGNNPSQENSGIGDNNPVNMVNLYQALVFCNKLSMREGLTPVYSIGGSTDPARWGSASADAVQANWGANGYRLPTEAEWEFAARGGNSSRGYTYAGGNDIGSLGWYYENSGRKTQPVATKEANELGLHDMSGNVWEWCWDRYGTYSEGTQDNPRGATSGSSRVLRGGSWTGYSGFMRSASRGATSHQHRYDYVGFRVVRSP